MEEVTLCFGKPIQNKGQLTSKHIFVGLVVMNKGFGAKARNQYEEVILPIAQKYGMELKNSFSITEFKAGVGPKSPLRLNLWEIEDPDLVKKLGEDPNYKNEIPNRNKIHDMEKLTLYLAKQGK